MVTKDKQKNAEYVQKCRNKKMEEMGIDVYNKMMAAKQRDYRIKQKQTKAIIKIQNAIRNRNAINEFATRYVDKYYKESYLIIFNQLYKLICDDDDLES